MRAQICNARWRGVSKHEGTQVGCSRLEHSILPISGKPEIGGRPSFETAASPPPQDEAARARAESRLVAEPLPCRRISRCQTAHVVSFPRACARVSFSFTHPIEGWAERRQAHLLVFVAPFGASEPRG
jgi:hypothetical protein